MTDNTSEQQLANEAKSALLIALKEAAQKNLGGDRVLAYAQAYAALADVHRPEAEGGVPASRRGLLDGRR